MEKKYQEQLKYLQDETQNEREMVQMQMARLRGDCEQQVQHMQQINMKCKEYCSQLEQVGCIFLGLIIIFLDGDYKLIVGLDVDYEILRDTTR